MGERWEDERAFCQRDKTGIYISLVGPGRTGNDPGTDRKKVGVNELGIDREHSRKHVQENQLGMVGNTMAGYAKWRRRLKRGKRSELVELCLCTWYKSTWYQ